MELERKILLPAQADIKISGDGAGILEGYASTFGNIDSYGDTVEPGAYTDTITADFLPAGFFASNHDWSVRIGFPTDVKQDAVGLYVRGPFHSTPAAQEIRTQTLERLQAGKKAGLSIGYEVQEFEMRKVETPFRGMFGELTDMVRVLKKIKLFEVSVVSVPADTHAWVTGAKSLSFEDHSDRVRVAVSELVERCKAGSALRAKVGRAISEARRTRMAGVRDSLAAAIEEIDGLLKETEPQKDTAEPDGWALYAAFQRIRAEHLGVTRT